MANALALPSRLWRHHRLVALSVALTLAVGIGVTTFVGALLDAVLLRPLPLPQEAGVAVIWGINQSTGEDHVGLPYGLAKELEARNPAVLRAGTVMALGSAPFAARDGRAPPQRAWSPGLGWLLSDLGGATGTRADAGGPRRLSRRSKRDCDQLWNVATGVWRRFSSNRSPYSRSLAFSKRLSAWRRQNSTFRRTLKYGLRFVPPMPHSRKASRRAMRIFSFD